MMRAPDAALTVARPSGYTDVPPAVSPVGP